MPSPPRCALGHVPARQPFAVDQHQAVGGAHLVGVNALRHLDVRDLAGIARVADVDDRRSGRRLHMADIGIIAVDDDLSTPCAVEKADLANPLGHRHAVSSVHPVRRPSIGRRCHVPAPSIPTWGRLSIGYQSASRGRRRLALPDMVVLTATSRHVSGSVSMRLSDNRDAPPAGHLPGSLRRRLDRGAGARDRDRAERRDADHGDRRRRGAGAYRRARRGDRAGRGRAVRGAGLARRRDHRGGCRPARQHAVRQHLAARRRGSARCRASGRDVRGLRRPASRLARVAPARRRGAPGADLHGAQAAGPGAGAARRARRPLRPRRHRLRQGRSRSRRPDLCAVRRAGAWRSLRRSNASARRAGR